MNSRRSRESCVPRSAAIPTIPTTRIVTLDMDRVAAIAKVSAHYESLFGNDPATAELREAYAMKNDTVPDAGHRHALTAFFWWTAWAAMTERPGSTVTYTNNWPGEPLIGNAPTPTHVSVVGVQRALPDRWHRVAGLASRGDAWPRGNASSTACKRSNGHGARDAVDESDGPLFLDRACPVSRADPAGRDDRALPGRGPAALRIPARRRAALYADANLAHTARGPVDRGRLARHRPIHRAGYFRP